MTLYVNQVDDFMLTSHIDMVSSVNGKKITLRFMDKINEKQQSHNYLIN